MSFFPWASAEGLLCALQSVTARISNPFSFSRIFIGHLPGEKWGTGLQYMARHWCSGQLGSNSLGVLFFSLPLLAGECEGRTAAILFGEGRRSTFYHPCLKTLPGSPYTGPVPPRGQAKNQKLQGSGEVMGEFFFDYFYFNGSYGSSEMTTWDSRKNELLWSRVLDEGKKTKTIIRLWADVDKEPFSPLLDSI